MSSSDPISSTTTSSGEGNISSSSVVVAPWKLFKVTSKPRTRESLPDPPAGMEWVQNPTTFEWRLVKAASNINNDATSDATTKKSTTKMVETERMKIDAPSSVRSVNSSMLLKDPEPTIMASLSERVMRLVSPERPTPSSPTTATAPTPVARSHPPSNNERLTTSVQPESEKQQQNPVVVYGTTQQQPQQEQKLWNENEMKSLLVPGLSNIQSSTGTTAAIISAAVIPPRHPKQSGNSSNSTAIRSFAASPTSSTRVVIDHLPTTFLDGSNSNRRNSRTSNNNNNHEDDWELLSDRQSSLQSAGGYFSTGSYTNNPSISSHNNSISKQPNHHSNNPRNGSTAGSVRSIDDDDTTNWEISGGAGDDHSKRSVPFKIQRTTSSTSSLDSSDVGGGTTTMFIGPGNKGVFGVDYVEHIVLPTDTLQGICLAYKISSTRLRQVNHFSGNSLLLAPKKLVIPISKQALRQGYIRVQDTDAKEYKIHAFLAEFTEYGRTEAKAYLELSDWVLEDAIRSAREDGEWEHSDDITKMIRSKNEEDEDDYDIDDEDDKHQNRRRHEHYGLKSVGELRVAMHQGVSTAAAAAAAAASALPLSSFLNGIHSTASSAVAVTPPPRLHKSKSMLDDESYTGCDDDDDEIVVDGDYDDDVHMKISNSIKFIQPVASVSHTPANKITVHKLKDLPGAIATKTVQVQDVYKASSQHNNFGVELQSFPPNTR